MKLIKRLWKNWTVHNMISHPASELAFWGCIPFVGKETATVIAGKIHDCTIPDHTPGKGRG